MSGCILSIRIITLIATIVALALAIVGVLMDVATLKDPSASPNGYSSGSFTLWKAKIEESGSTVTGDMATQFFLCKKGRLNIQAVQAVAVVACVLCGANFFLALFTFLMEPVVRYPLALYGFLAAAASATAFGMLIDAFSSGWCSAGLKEEGWEYATGFMLMIVSCAASVVVALLSVMRCSCCE